MMRALLRGQKQQQHLEALEQAIQNIEEDEWQQDLMEHTTDRAWGKVALRQTCANVFAKEGGVDGLQRTTGTTTSATGTPSTATWYRTTTTP